MFFGRHKNGTDLKKETGKTNSKITHMVIKIVKLQFINIHDITLIGKFMQKKKN